MNMQVLTGCVVSLRSLLLLVMSSLSDGVQAVVH